MAEHTYCRFTFETAAVIRESALRTTLMRYYNDKNNLIFYNERKCLENQLREQQTAYAEELSLRNTTKAAESNSIKEKNHSLTERKRSFSA